MTKLTRWIPLLALTLLAALPAGLRGAQAQSAGGFGPVISVNGLGITEYEITQRQHFIELLSAGGATRDDAETALIDDRLRLWSAKQIGMSLSDEQVQKGMAEFASRANITVEQFLATLQKAGIDPNTFRDFVRAGMLWREEIRARFAHRVSITDADIDRAMQPYSEVGNNVNVLISEAIIPVQPGQEQQVMAVAKQISAARGETAFAQLARSYSASQSAAQGGRLNWMPLSNLPPQLQGTILKLKPGTATPPIPLNGAVAVFMLRALGDAAPKRGPQAISYMTLALGPTGSDQSAKLQSAAAKTRTCKELYSVAKGLPAAALIAHDDVAQAKIPTDLGLAMADLDKGESTVLHRGGLDTLVMLCNRALLPQGDAQAPTRAQVRAQLENKALSDYAQGYLADLHADAVIVRK